MRSTLHPRLTHPLTGQPILPAGYRNPRPGRGEVGPQPIWPIAGGDPTNDDPPKPNNAGGDLPKPEDASGGNGGNGDQPKPDAGAGAAKNDAKGFPENTAVAEMKPEEQAAYWKHQSRKHEDAHKAWESLGKEHTPDTVRKLIEDGKPDSEKALEAAKAEGRAEARAEVNQQIVDGLVAARLSAIGKKAEEVPALGALDLTKFVSEDGRIDTAKVTDVLDAIAPTTGGTTTPKPDRGNGNRGSGTQSAKDAGKAEAARRFGKDDAQK